MLSYIRRSIHLIRSNTIASKLTIIFARTSRIMITDPHLRKSIIYSIKEQECIPESESVHSYFDKKLYSTQCCIKLLNSRSINAVAKYKSSSTCVLNFACSTEPGGGVLEGSVAQEESLCRSSTLYPCLSDVKMYEEFYYPHICSRNFINNDDCIYTPCVTVFQTDELFPKLLDKKEWIHTNIITCCAPALNHTRLLGQSLYELHFKRLCRILDIAASKKNDVIILGAFGCGAFRNNPYIVSEAMMNVIKHYRYVFKKIVFAIPSNDKSDSNYAIFKKAVLSHFIETQKNEKTIQ